MPEKFFIFSGVENCASISRILHRKTFVTKRFHFQVFSSTRFDAPKLYTFSIFWDVRSYSEKFREFEEKWIWSRPSVVVFRSTFFPFEKKRDTSIISVLIFIFEGSQKRCDKQVSSWRQISCHTDKNGLPQNSTQRVQIGPGSVFAICRFRLGAERWTWRGFRLGGRFLFGFVRFGQIPGLEANVCYGCVCFKQVRLLKWLMDWISGLQIGWGSDLALWQLKNRFYSKAQFFWFWKCKLGTRAWLWEFRYLLGDVQESIFDPTACMVRKNQFWVRK